MIISLQREKYFAIEHNKTASTAKGFKTMAAFDPFNSCTVAINVFNLLEKMFN